jgi:hypothetical protein
MARLFLLCGLLACLLSASSCGLLNDLFSRKHPTEHAKSSDMLIGVIESVNPEQKFVLVRTDLRMVLPTGTKLESRSLRGAKASLVLTPERKTNFLSADIADGLPMVGDIVILPAQAAPLPAPSMVIPESGLPAPAGAELPLRVPAP